MDINLKNEVTFLKKPVGILFIITILLIIVSYVGIKNLSSVKTKIDENKIIETTLGQKVLILETVTSVLPDDITFLDIVLPSKGAVLYGISQVKNQAITFNLLISNMKSGTTVAEENGVSKNSINFEILGEEQNVYQFLDSFSKLLPLMIIDRVSFDRSSNLIRAEVAMSVYSANLPQKISSLTGAINELTSQEINLLKEIVTYGLPQFTEPKVSDVFDKKVDPFN